MTLLRRPATVALLAALSVLGALLVLERGSGGIADITGAERQFFAQAAPGGGGAGSPSLAASAAGLQRVLAAQTANGGTVQEHVPPFVSATVCPILTAAAAQVNATFDALIAAFPGLAPFLETARQNALAAIGAQLEAFHCVVSP
jgi:hypothetical protein